VVELPVPDAIFREYQQPVLFLKIFFGFDSVDLSAQIFIFNGLAAF
jgi:hypothetical protein